MTRSFSCKTAEKEEEKKKEKDDEEAGEEGGKEKEDYWCLLATISCYQDWQSNVWSKESLGI